MKMSYSFGAKFENLHGKVALVTKEGPNCIVLQKKFKKLYRPGKNNTTICRSTKIAANLEVL